jgi:hypothetical protein
MAVPAKYYIWTIALKTSIMTIGQNPQKTEELVLRAMHTAYELQNGGAFRFDFAFPVGAFGFSSGWRHTLDRSEATKRFDHGELFFRRPVYLHRVGTGSWWPHSRGTPIFDLLVKYSRRGNNALPGLSSGAGSALLKRQGQVFRYKRCGSRDVGFLGGTEEVFYCADRDDIFEFGDAEPIGLLALERARKELEIIGKLHDAGLCPHCRPFGLVQVLSLEGVNRIPSGAAVFEITSDVRVDEFVMICLTPLIFWLLDQNFYRFRPSDFSMIPIRAPVAQIVETWGITFDRLSRIGNLVGRSYRKFYEAGYLRGRGNAWLGNDVIGADARISIVDVDEVMSEPGHSKERRSLFQAIEVNEYIGRINALLSGQCSFPIFFGVASTFLTDGFREGFSGNGTALSIEDINKTVTDFERFLMPLRDLIISQSPAGYLPPLFP